MRVYVGSNEKVVVPSSAEVGEAILKFVRKTYKPCDSGRVLGQRGNTYECDFTIEQSKDALINYTITVIAQTTTEKELDLLKKAKIV